MTEAPPKLFSATELEAIARALGHMMEGLSGSEIGTVLTQCRIGVNRRPRWDPPFSRVSRCNRGTFLNQLGR